MLATKKTIYFLLLFFLLADIGFSFVQHLNQPLDGDMAWNLIPASDVKPIFESPLGINAIVNNQTYANPNRFFCHWIFKEYLISTPLFLQNFVDPIESVYLACAISKIIIQISLIVFLAMAISNTKNIFKIEFMIAAVLVAPLFQTNGYRSYMGIIDPSTTYTFFYAMPCALLLLYLLPFMRQFYYKKKPFAQIFIYILWIPLALIVCLSGPLNPGIVLVFSLLVFMNKIKNNFNNSGQNGFIKKISNAIIMIPINYWFYLLPICIFSLYSLFLGRYNSITLGSQIPLSEMYSRLPEGIYYPLTQKLGFPVLLIILTINSFLIKKRYRTPEGIKILSIFKWIGIFAFIYILLLPLGGYREYRYYILRYDTIMPITLSLIFVFGISTLFLIKNMSRQQRIWYLPIILIVLFIYTNADEARFENNKCEKVALKEISASKDAIVRLPNGCCVLAWNTITKPEDSELNSQLLKIWRITKEKKLYYNE